MSNPDIIVSTFPWVFSFARSLSLSRCLHSLPTDPIYPQTPWPWCCVLVQRAPSWVQFSPSSFRSFPTLRSTPLHSTTTGDVRRPKINSFTHSTVYVCAVSPFLSCCRSPKEPRRVSFLYPSRNTLFLRTKKQNKNIRMLQTTHHKSGAQNKSGSFTLDRKIHISVSYLKTWILRLLFLTEQVANRIYITQLLFISFDRSTGLCVYHCCKSRDLCG